LGGELNLRAGAIGRCLDPATPVVTMKPFLLGHPIMATVQPVPADARPVLWLLCGGPSSEYHVSLASARTVLGHIDYQRFCVRLACLAPDGHWLLSPKVFSSAPDQSAIDETFALLAFPDTFPVSLTLGEALDILSQDRPGAAFNAMHGRVGEDGVIQGLFAMANVPMTGSGVGASSLAMDKMRSRLMFESAGLLTPKAFTFTEVPGKPRPSGLDVEKRVGFPCFVKPVFGGSSVGVSRVGSASELAAALDAALADGPQILIEEAIVGTEVTCGVLEDEHGVPRPLTPTEIRVKAGVFFDFKSKYVAGQAEEITPAGINADETAQVKSAATLAHQALGCSGSSRSDFILANDGRLYILELNALPGLTATSLLPQGAAAQGITFPALVMRLISAAIRRRSSLPFAVQGPAPKPGEVRATS